jgi:hypothetical protein
MLSRYVDSAYAIYHRIGDPPSEIMSLIDAKRWQFMKYFHDLPRCIAALSMKPNSRFADELADEMRALLSVPPWQIFGNGQGRDGYPNGITILTSQNEGSATCASRLAEWINSQTPIAAQILPGQAPPMLRQCNDESIEIHIGGGVPR